MMLCPSSNGTATQPESYILINLRWSIKMGNLLYWALTFLIVAIVAALLGFGGVAGTAMEGAKLLFWVAIILAVVSAVIGLVRR